MGKQSISSSRHTVDKERTPEKERAREPQPPRITWEEAKMIWQAREAYRVETALLGWGLVLALGLALTFPLWWRQTWWSVQATAGLIAVWWLWHKFRA